MSFDSDDFTNALQYPFQDPQWFSKLCLQGALLILLSCVVVGIPFFIGYMVRCTQKAINGEATLPGWNEWGMFWHLGWRALVLNLFHGILAWTIPFVLLILFGFIAFLEGGKIEDSQVLTVLGLLLYGPLFLAALYMYCAQFFIAAAVAQKQPLSKGFSLRSVWRYTTHNFGAIVFAWVTAAIAGVLAYAGLLLLLIGYLLTLPYQIAVTGWVQGMVYKKAAVKVIE